jgi:hypothetical protein
VPHIRSLGGIPEHSRPGKGADRTGRWRCGSYRLAAMTRRSPFPSFASATGSARTPPALRWEPNRDNAGLRLTRSSPHRDHKPDQAEPSNCLSTVGTTQSLNCSSLPHTRRDYVAAILGQWRKPAVVGIAAWPAGAVEKQVLPQPRHSAPGADQLGHAEVSMTEQLLRPEVVHGFLVAASSEISSRRQEFGAFEV